MKKNNPKTVGLKPCEDCQNPISTGAYECPHCGMPHRKRPRLYAGEVAVAIIVAEIFLAIGDAIFRHH
jgi:hypothetical protein